MTDRRLGPGPAYHRCLVHIRWLRRDPSNLEDVAQILDKVNRDNIRDSDFSPTPEELVGTRILRLQPQDTEEDD